MLSSIMFLPEKLFCVAEFKIRIDSFDFQTKIWAFFRQENCWDIDGVFHS